MARSRRRPTASALGATLLLAAAAEGACPARWERRASMGVARQEVGVAAIGDVLYAVGGFAGSEPSAAVEAYDPRADRWTAVAPLPVARHHVVVAATGGVLYAAGGLGAPTPGGAADETFAYDPATNAWTPRAPLPRPRGAGAAATIDGRVYVVGGIAGAPVRDLAVYDPAADVWTELAPMPTARDHLAAGAIGGRLYAVGGRSGGTLFDVVEVFDPASGAWSGGRARMPTARGGLGAAILGELLYAVGGEGNAASPSGTFPQAEAYDPARDAWTRLPDMGVPRHGVGVAAIAGALYAMGGSTRQGLGPSGAGEVFVPGTGEALAIRRFVAGARGRLSVHARLAAAATVDLAAVPIRIEVEGGDTFALPARSLVPSRAGTRWRLPRPGDSGVARFVARVRRSDLGLRLVLAGATSPAAGAEATVTVALAQRTFCGSARVRRGR